MLLLVWLREGKPFRYYIKSRSTLRTLSLLGGKQNFWYIFLDYLEEMFPVFFLFYVVAVKVFKKTTPNGKLI